MNKNILVENNLSKLHDALFEFLCDFKSLCDKLCIRFYLGYGTLLGAARHKGFIPWDDDIDLLMTRADYNILVNYFKNNIDNDFYLSALDINNNHSLIFGKLIQKNSEQELSKYFDEFEGLSIDIFPLDYSRSKKNINERMKIIFILYLKRVYSSKSKLKRKESLIKKIGRYIFVLPFIFIKNKKLLLFIDKLCKKNKCKKFYVCYGGLSTRECYINSVDKWNSMTLMFNDIPFNVCDDYTEMLKAIYGNNWYQLPPLKKRTQHNHEN